MATLNDLLATALPLNRKERYYTGTVLPAVLCADSMRHLARLGRADLLGIGHLDIRSDPNDCTVLFFTEYSIKDSAIGTWGQTVDLHLLAGDTPDVVILVTSPKPVMIALEAKMFHRPSAAALNQQVTAQKKLLRILCAGIAERLNVDHVDLKHFLLLPSKYADGLPTLASPVITWEQVLKAYSDVDQAYFLAVLRAALDGYDELASKVISNQHATHMGLDLVRWHFSQDEVWPFMGVSGGLNGKTLAKLLPAGWESRVFQCRTAALEGNGNWFSVAEFIDKLRTSGVDIDDLGAPADGESL